MRAQDYFEQVRETVIEIERSTAMLTKLKASEGLGCQSYGAHYSSELDAMDKINRRLEFEAQLERRAACCHELLDEATEVLYGSDEMGGLAKSAGFRYADAVCLAYCQAMQWSEVAKVMDCSAQWCRELAQRAFAHMDAVGFARLRET